MEPLIASAAIGAGASMLSGLFQSAAAKKREARQMAHETEQKGFEQQIAAAQGLTQGQQRAFNDLVQNFAMALR